MSVLSLLASKCTPTGVHTTNLMMDHYVYILEVYTGFEFGLDLKTNVRLDCAQLSWQLQHVLQEY